VKSTVRSHQVTYYPGTDIAQTSPQTRPIRVAGCVVQTQRAHGLSPFTGGNTSGTSGEGLRDPVLAQRRKPYLEFYVSTFPKFALLYGFKPASGEHEGGRTGALQLPIAGDPPITRCLRFLAYPRGARCLCPFNLNLNPHMNAQPEKEKHALRTYRPDPLHCPLRQYREMMRPLSTSG